MLLAPGMCEVTDHRIQTSVISRSNKQIIKLGTELITLLTLFAMHVLFHGSTQKLGHGQSGIDVPEANSCMIKFIQHHKMLWTQRIHSRVKDFTLMQSQEEELAYLKDCYCEL